MDEPDTIECEYKSTLIIDKSLKGKAYVCTRPTRKDVLSASEEYLRMINTKTPDRRMKRAIVQKTVENIHNYFNKGYLEYRKSVTEAGDFAAIEWQGRGSVISDVMGRKYLDFLGGYGIYNMGIRHPKIVRAVESQLLRMPLNSQELLEPLRGGLSKLIAELSPGDLQQCFFISNGTDAVEGAMKLARLYTGRPGFISTIDGFHGKSMGSLSLMGKGFYREPFEPLLDDVYFVPFGDAQALEDQLRKLSAVGKKIAAFVVEPVQGEAGARVPPDGYLPKVREICDEFGVLLVVDEVQTGMGRTGKVFAVEHWNVVPDIMCLGKSLGGGVMPLSAFVSTKKIFSKLEKNPFLHTTTFGGNPLACAAGIAAVNVMLEEDLPKQAAEKGAYLLERLKPLQKRHSALWTSVHGKGLLMGMDFADDAVGYEVAAGLFRKGILVAGTLISSKTIRIEPALNIPVRHLDTFVNEMERIMERIEKEGVHRNHKLP